MKTLNVNASKPYKVTISDSLKDFFYEAEIIGKVCIVTDKNVAPLYLDEAAKLFDAKVFTIVFEAGEKTKSVECYLKLIGFLHENFFTRGDVIVALGGGVIGDLAGFAAATYMRGINYLSLPTTLLSMIDSSIGGKTAVNFENTKNLVGCFYQPDYVYVNTGFLKSLPKSEIYNGLGELIKYSFLQKDGIIECSPKGYPEITEDVIYKSLVYKAKIVEADEFDKGKRALLNLGHTVGHAIEALSDYAVLHGICVFKGIAAAISVSEKFYGLNDKTVKKMNDYLDLFLSDRKIDFPKDAILCKIAEDKKRLGDYINFVCIRNFGDCRVEKITLKRLGELL